ncbi:MAG TPA: hypothetical protein VN442_23635 [Bryobacteraceae bacterium]|nr:hypothetical protein [Bryobacteraceae bacterium]
MWMGIVLAAALVQATAPPADENKTIEEQALRELLKVRRVYVDRLGGGETAAQLRDMIVSSLQSARLFVVTENQERADAILRGSGEDLVYTDTHASSESLSARGSVGSTKTSTRRGEYAGFGLGESESTRSTERRHEASAAVRLVNKDGDVIWSTTQESTGGKFRGASADVADRITRILKEDFDRARRLEKPASSR